MEAKTESGEPFGKRARWIWLPGAERARNRRVCFRRGFRVDGAPGAATLRLTADSRYELFMNGEWLGFGPARAWPEHWSFDEYDLRAVLRPGENVLAVSVHEWGVGTLQYVDAPPGLLAECRWRDGAGGHALVTDRRWRCLEDPGFVSATPRICLQQAWEERYDARRAVAEWSQTSYDDSGWRRAAPSPSAEAAHTGLTPRAVPFLTRNPLDPARHLGTEPTRTPSLCATLDYRDAINPVDRSANLLLGEVLAAGRVYSPVRQPAGFWLHVGEELKVNGREAAWGPPGIPGLTHGRYAELELEEGWNRFLFRSPGARHDPRFDWALFARTPVSLENHGDGDWTVFGPAADDNETARDVFHRPPHVVPLAPPPGATRARLQDIWTRGWHGPDDRAAAVPKRFSSRLSVGTLCLAEQACPPIAEEPRGMEAGEAGTGRDAGADAAQAAAAVHPYPAACGGVRLLYDFGRTVVGFVTLEVDAPAGTVLDATLFEFIQPDGRRNLAEGMSNSFRYIAREGRQRFRSRLRRGGRYLCVTARDFKVPIRLRHAGIIESIHPQRRAGHFACDDKRLDRIWEVSARSVACCSEDTYTDCPTYEQAFWVGDGRNESMVDLVVNGDPRLSAHSWRVAAQGADGLLNSQAPSAWSCVIPAWVFLWMRWAEEHWQATGDHAFGVSALEAVDRQVHAVEQRLDPEGLFDCDGWNLFDWAPMDTPNRGVVTHQNCLAVLALGQVADMAEALARPDRARAWRGLADAMAAAVDRHLWNGEAGAYIDCIHRDGRRSRVFSQQTQAAALLAGIARGERRRRCLAILDHPPPGFVTAGSPFFMSFLLEILAREERWDALTRRILDYWGGQVDAGATTFWEMYHPEAPRMTRSHCHGWSAAPAFFLSRHLLGVHPAAPGYASVLIAPRGPLAWCRGAVPTPRGVVNCYWERRRGGVFVDASAPAGVPVRIDLPGEVHREPLGDRRMRYVLAM